MPQMITGTRDTNNITQSKRVIDMSEKIALLQPNKSQFLSVLQIMKQNKRVVTNPKFEWMEDDYGARWDAINNAAGYTNAETNIIVDNGVYFSPGYVVKVPRTGEVMLVKSVNVNTLTVARGYGVTAAAALVDNDPILIIGNANQEGAKSPEIKTTKEVGQYNFTQIFRTPFGVTRTNDKSKMYGGKDLKWQRAKKGVEHKVQIETALILGERKEDLSGAKPMRTAGGVLSFSNRNNYDAGGQLTQSEFDNSFAEVMFKKGSGEKLLIASARLLSVINGWAMGKLMIDEEAKKFGLDIRKYVTPHGIFNLMNGSQVLEGATYGGYGICIDPENISYTVLEGSDTQLKTNIQDNDEDGVREEYLTECSIEVRLPDTHGVITGVTS